MEPPPFQEAARCDVCKCSFNTFRRRVSSFLSWIFVLCTDCDVRQQELHLEPEAWIGYLLRALFEIGKSSYIAIIDGKKCLPSLGYWSFVFDGSREVWDQILQWLLIGSKKIKGSFFWIDRAWIVNGLSIPTLLGFKARVDIHGSTSHRFGGFVK